MENIDWDKAPEGATHYHAPNEFFYRYVGDALMVFRDGKWGESHLMDHSRINLIQRPSPSWSGEGLPPVGVVCEAAIPHTSGPDNDRSFIWIEGRVIAYHEINGKTYAWFAEGDGFYPPNILEFRPIRTPEQIAADERELAVAEMQRVMAERDQFLFSACEALYDAGYRKHENQK